MRVQPPPSSVTGPLATWLNDITRVMNASPAMSYFSADTPESLVTGAPGQLAINVVSGSSTRRAWLKTGDPSATPNRTGWVPLGVTAAGSGTGADFLNTPRSISATGDAAWSVTFDGSADVTAALTLATVATAGTTGGSTAIPVITIDAKGRTTGITTAAVVAPAGTLTGTILASNVVTSSLTTIGTLVAGAVPASLVTAGTFGAGNFALSGTAVLTLTTVTATNLGGTLTTAAQPNITSVGTLTSMTSTGSVTAGAAVYFIWSGRSVMASPSDGVITLTNQAVTSFTRLNLGGDSSSFPSLKRSGAALVARLADDSANAAFTCAALTASTGTFSGAVSGITTLAGSGAVTGFTSYTLANGNYYKATRNTSSSVIDVLGFVTGTDNLVLNTGGSTGATSFSIVNTAAAAMLTITNAGAATFAGAVDGITTLTGSGAVSGFTSWTGTGRISTTLTTEQLRLSYDSDSYMTVTVASSNTTSIESVGNLNLLSNGGTPGLQCNGTTLTLLASLFPASVAARASIRLPHGTAPSSPVDGDVWTTTAGLFVQINGSTIGPLS